MARLDRAIAHTIALITMARSSRAMTRSERRAMARVERWAMTRL
jgi:hypothetical protein